jgi:hypothetical protein
MNNDEGVFWISFITIISGCSLKVLSVIYKSKCTRVEIGCIKIDRNIEQEEKIDEMEMNKLQRTNSNIS